MPGSDIRKWFRQLLSGNFTREFIDGEVDNELLTPIENAVRKDTTGDISGLTEKATPVSADVLMIEDSAASNAKKKVQIGNLPAGTDSDAIHDNVSGEISLVAEKVTPVSGDLLLIEDSAAANAKKRVQIGNLPTGSDADAIHDNVAAEISAVAEKTTVVSADLVLIEDSAASNAKKRLQLGNIITSLAPSDPFINRNHVLWNNVLFVSDFMGDATAIDLWTPVEPIGDAGSWAQELGVGGHARVYVNDVTSGNYINVGFNDVWQTGAPNEDVWMACRCARTAHAGSLGQRQQVMFQQSNAAAYNRNLAGFRADAGGNWLALSASQSAEETTDTGVAADGTFRWLEVHMTASGTVTFYIDGALEATHTTHTPSGTYGQPVLRGEVINQGTGNEDKMWVDCVMLKLERDAVK